MEYSLYSGNGQLLGKVECASVEEAGLFLAMNFPEDYFGANIVGDKTRIIAVKKAFGDETITPIKAELQVLNSKMKINNGFYIEEHDKEGILKKPYANLVSENGKIKGEL